MNRDARQVPGPSPSPGVTPLRVDFLPPDALALPGRLGLTMAPGRRDQEPRDLVADLRLLRAGHGVDLLVTLLTQEELSHLGIADLFARAAEVTLLSLWFPLPDGAAPPSRTRLRGLVEHMIETLDGGATIVLHCREGRGRAGLVAAACLRALGASTVDALRRVRAARPGAVETPEQERFLATCY